MMDENIALRLNAINQAFYQTTADDFDATRATAWAGWARLHDYLPDAFPLRVLDIGCGNGRFGAFLAQTLPNPARLHYHGIDNSAALLDYARNISTQYLQAQFTFDQRDLLIDPLPEEQYDCVVLFGVLHHIPGMARRVALIEQSASRVSEGGILAFTQWRFYEYERFRARIVTWDAVGIDPAKLETGDTLLDWRRGERALRYCHYGDDAERDKLNGASGLTVVAQYRADGFTNAVNAYSILRR